RKTQEAGADVILLPSRERSTGIKDATVSQVVRLYAAAMNVSEDDYIITSDADMFPLSRDHFNQQGMEGDDVHLFYANAYAHMKDSVMYPLCYVGASVRTWRDIMQIPPSSI